MFRYCSLD